ncbi:hypothetical protein U0070_007966, partial [Myodes glareolus]
MGGWWWETMDTHGEIPKRIPFPARGQARKLEFAGVQLKACRAKTALRGDINFQSRPEATEPRAAQFSRLQAPA